MPRPRRADEAGGLYHALNRANGRLQIFWKDDDDSAFERKKNPGDTKTISVCRVSRLMTAERHGAKASQGARTHKFLVVALPENA